VLMGISKGTSLEEMTKAVLPFFILLLLGLVLMNVFPQVVTWLPDTMLDIAG